MSLEILDAIIVGVGCLLVAVCAPMAINSGLDILDIIHDMGEGDG